MVKIESKIPTVGSCCGCMSLENGTVFILWISLIVGILLMFLPYASIRIAASSPPPEFWEALIQSQESWIKMIDPNLVPQILNPELIPQLASPGQIEGEINIGNSWVNFPMGLVTVIVSAVALYGVFEENDAKYLFPYLSWCATLFVILLLLILFSPVGLILLLFIFAVINIAFFIYCLLVVYSYYRSMKTTKSSRGYRRVQQSDA